MNQPRSEPKILPSNEDPVNFQDEGVGQLRPFPWATPQNDPVIEPGRQVFLDIEMGVGFAACNEPHINVKLLKQRRELDAVGFGSRTLTGHSLRWPWRRLLLSWINDSRWVCRWVRVLSRSERRP